MLIDYLLFLDIDLGDIAYEYEPKFKNAHITSIQCNSDFTIENN